MYQVFSHPPGQPRQILGYFPGHTPGQAIAAATVALGLPPHAPHIRAWLVLTRHLFKQGNYISIKPAPKVGNEGAISHNAHTVYVDCRQFFGRAGQNELHERMSIDGVHPNTNGGAVMGAGGGRGYIGYNQFSSEQQAISYLLNLAFILPLYDNAGALISTFHPYPKDAPNVIALPAKPAPIAILAPPCGSATNGGVTPPAAPTPPLTATASMHLPPRPWLIRPPYPKPISTVYPHGTLAIPDLPWVAGTPPLVLVKMGSFRSMFTTVSKAGYAATLQHYLPHVRSSAALVAHDINVLETGIMADIGTVISSGLITPTNPLLSNIAVGIQLWGGNASRRAFNKTGGFAVSCPLGVYAKMINLLMAHPFRVALPGGNWAAIFSTRTAFPGIGVSFLTKHLSFWSRAPGSPIHLPILDSIVKKILIDPRLKRLPTWSDYIPYVTELYRNQAIIAARTGLSSITVSDMERQLFNWANSSAASNWIR